MGWLVTWQFGSAFQRRNLAERTSFSFSGMDSSSVERPCGSSLGHSKAMSNVSSMASPDPGTCHHRRSWWSTGICGDGSGEELGSWNSSSDNRKWAICDAAVGDAGAFLESLSSPSASRSSRRVLCDRARTGPPSILCFRMLFSLGTKGGVKLCVVIALTTASDAIILAG